MSVPLLTPAQQARHSERSALVNRVQARGISFQNAWNEARTLRPDLFDESDEAAASGMQTTCTTGADGNTCEQWKSYVQKLASENGWSFATAWERAKQSNPDLWAQMTAAEQEESSDMPIREDVAPLPNRTAPKLAPLMNRATPGGFALPADGWFHLAPLGEFPVNVIEADGTEKQFVQVIDKPAVQSMARMLRPGGELLIDFEHFSQDQGKSSEAAGWIQELQVREDGLWMRPKWSDSGESAIRGGRFRYISPVWEQADCQQIGLANDGRTPRVRPLRISNAGLTNCPNLRGLVPLSSN